MIKFKKVDYAGINNLYIVHWPHTCVSCGSSTIEDVKPEYTRLMSSIQKKLNNVETTVRTNVKAKLFLCRDCRKEIIIANKIPSKGLRGHGGLAKKLASEPYKQFVNLTSNGVLWVAEGQFKEKITELNPLIEIESGKNPLSELKDKIPKDAEIPEVSAEELDAWPPQFAEEDEIQADTEKVAQLRSAIESDPKIANNWFLLVQELVSQGRCEAAAEVVRNSVKYADMNTVRDMMKVVSKNCEKYKV
ncbi:MAG: hypothetical protein ACXADF_18665 [Candidatus Thorarchaeota archaeon]